jgi:predicted Zn-dependent protease
MKFARRSRRIKAVTSLIAGVGTVFALPIVAEASFPTAESSPVYGLLFEQAAMWRERNRFDLAAQSLRKILESQPDNTEALFQLGSVELQSQHFEQVRATISRLRQIDPTDPRATELERAMAIGQTDEVALAEARRLAAGGAYDKAIAAYQRAFRGGPPPFDLAVEYYETLAGTGSGWEEARLRLKALAERSFATSRVKFAYARILTYNEQTRREGIAMLADLASDPAVGQAAFAAMRQGMLWLTISPQDRPFFESYLRRFPGDTMIRDKLANALKPPKLDPLAAAIGEAYRLSDQGLNEQAIARFDGVLQSDPNNVDAIVGIGMVRLRQERFADARDQFLKAARLAPERQSEWAQALEAANFWAAYRDAVALRDRGDLSQAEKLIRPLTDHRGKERTAAQSLLADLLRRQGKQREAETYYRDALADDPVNKDAQVGLYQVLKAQGRDVQGEPLLRDMDGATRGRLQADAAHDGAARLRTQAKAVEASDPGRSEELYRQALQADPSSPWLRYDLAKLLLKRGRAGEAQPLIDELVATGRPESLFAAAVFYSEQGRTGEAASLIEQIPANQRSARMNSFRNDLRTAGDTDQLVAAAKAGDASARATILSRANAPNASQVQMGNSALSLAKIGERTQAIALVRRLMARRDLSAEALRLAFYASLEAGDDTEANAVLARMSRSTAGRDAGNLKEALAIRQSDRLREQHNLGAAYDALTPYVTVPTPSVSARLALARVYKDSQFTGEAMQVLDGIMVSQPANADTLQEAVNIAIDLKKYERADVWLAEALRLQPNNPRLYMVQARLLRARGDYAGARRALETAQQLNRGSQRSDASDVPADGGFQPVDYATGSVLSLLPNRRGKNAELLAAFEDRIASKTSHAASPARLDTTSREGPQVAQAAAGTRQASSQPPVQIAQNPLVPLRRPGSSGGTVSGGSPTYMPPPQSVSAAPSIPAPPSGPSASPGDTDPLSREITRELDSLKRDTAIVAEAGAGYRGRSGESGFGRLNDLSVPFKARFPVGNAALIPLVTPVALDAGPMGTDSGTLSRFGTNAVLAPANVVPPGSLRATGVAVGLGLEWGRLSVDVGSTPLGFPLSSVVGAVTWDQPLGDTMNLKLQASRRPVTDSLLSYAGVTDPVSGATWGGVVRNGVDTVVSYDDNSIGVYAKFAYGYYTGTNVADNQSYEFTTGGYFRPYKDEQSELKLGISGTYLSYNQNLSQFTFGQGGYFSPQSFYSLTFPIDWNETSGRFKYAAGGAIGLQSIQQNSSPYFPTNYYLQNAANMISAANGISPPVFLSTTTTGLAFALRLGFEYAVTDRTAVGAKATFDNSYQYDQGTVLLFLRSAFN